jgi:hypothetical protein
VVVGIVPAVACPVLAVNSPLPETHVPEEAALEVVEAVKG